MIEESLRTKDERARRPLRFLAFGVVTLALFGVLTSRLAYLQFAASPQEAARAVAPRTAKVAIPAPRGLIADRNGRPLVANVATFAVKITPSELPFSGRNEVAQRLGGLLGLDPADIITTLDTAPGSRFDPVRIAQEVPEDVARLISELSDELPGVRVVVETRREYPDRALFAHVLGYTGSIDAETYAARADEGYLADDVIGRAGIESTFERELRGTFGIDLMERDATGRDVQVLRALQDAVPGSSLTLTIDSEMQREATDALQWGMDLVGLQRGVFIAMNPQNGEVLALVSLPSYDNNLFAKGISTKAFQALLEDARRPLTNHATQAHYPPGSTYKLITGAGAIEDGEVTARTRLETKPYLTLGTTKFWDWNKAGFGYCDMDCGFGHSSDTYFYQLAGMLGADRLAWWGRQWGFGRPTGIDLPGETSGIVPSNQWKLDVLGQPMFAGEVYQAGIGQGYDVVTAIQMVNAYAALANGGNLYRPQLVREVVGPDGTVTRTSAPELIRRLPLSDRTLLEMRLASRAVVTLRHTYNLVDMPVKVAGKSGTAEFGLRDAKGRLPFHSWFVGWVPKNPYRTDFAATDSELVFIAFAYDSRTKGNAATEIVKAFLQDHYDIRGDYLNRDLLERGNFYQSP